MSEIKERDVLQPEDFGFEFTVIGTAIFAHPFGQYAQLEEKLTNRIVDMYEYTGKKLYEKRGFFVFLKVF